MNEISSRFTSSSKAVLLLLFAAVLLAASAASSSSQPAKPSTLAIVCARFDLMVMQSLDDNPIAEHLPSRVRAMAAQYQISARNQCVIGNIDKAIERYEIALALLGQPWATRENSVRLLGKQ